MRDGVIIDDPESYPGGIVHRRFSRADRQHWKCLAISVHNAQAVVLEVSESAGLALRNLHFGVEALGDPVVFGKSPHGGDFFPPGMKGVAELDQRSETGLAQFGGHAQQARRQLPAPFLIEVFFQQQIAELLFEAVDQLQHRSFTQVG